MGYFIDTPEGRKGPYSVEAIVRDLQEGKLQPNDRVVEEGTHRHLRAGQVAAVTSGPAPQPRPARMPAPRPLSHAGPHMNAPQPPSYGQYPAQAAHGQYPASPNPYPGNAGVPYPGNPAYPTQYQPYGAQQPQYMYVAARPTSGWAIASLICSLVTFVFCLPTWIVGIIGGVIALKECEPNGPKQGRGLALGGLWSGIAIGVVYVLAIVGWIALMAETGGF